MRDLQLIKSGTREDEQLSSFCFSLAYVNEPKALAASIDDSVKGNATAQSFVRPPYGQ
jgi:hypothetical protein